MSLEKLECKHCKTIFFGVKDRDTYCHICKTIILFRGFFELKDIEIDEIDFNRVRDPKFEEGHKDAGKPQDPKDWRSYIPQGLKDMWHQLPFEARVVAVMFAEREARAIDIVSEKVAEIIKEEPGC